MGAKDALTKIAKLNIGLEDTLTYYDDAAFIEGFKKTMKFQPRVVKQNRGSAGEGIWIIKLKEGNYCSSFGEASAGDDEVLRCLKRPSAWAFNSQTFFSCSRNDVLFG